MRYLPVIILILMLIFTNGCGPLVPEKVEVEHSVKVQNLEPYVRAYCEDNEPTNVEGCISSTLGELIHKL